MTDGRLHETEIFGEAHTRFPFKENSKPDHHARIHTRKFWCDPRRYVPLLSNRTPFENKLNSSDAFDPAAWANQAGFTRTADNAANPWDGAVTVDRLLEAAPVTGHLTGRAYAFTAAARHALWSILAPIGGRRFWRLRANDGTTNFDAVFDLVAGKLKSIAGAGVTASILKLEGGYFRIALMFTPLAAAGTVALAASTDGTFAAYAGDPTKGCFLAQIQLELGAAPGPLIVTAAAARSILAPDRDPEDIFAFLLTETDQGEYGGGLSAVQREFGRIPRRQWTYPGSKYITKPDYTPGSAYNPYDVTSGATAKGQAVNFPDEASLGNASYSVANGLWTSGDGSIYTSIKQPSAQTPAYATAGNFTLTRGANTTGALAWNADGPTICAALNALPSSIADGLNFYPSGGTNGLQATTGGFLVFNVNGGSDAARLVPVTMNPAGLTLSGANSPNARTKVFTANTQIIYLNSWLTINAHGLDTTKALAVCYGASGGVTIIYPPGYWGSQSANVIWVLAYNDPGKPATLVGTYASTFVLSAEGSYAGGTRLAGRQVYTDYYLPGVSAGIDDPSDITSPPGMQNPSTFLTALLTPLAGYQDFESDGASSWLGLIYGRPVMQVNFDDLV
jgi:hypothetical protein